MATYGQDRWSSKTELGLQTILACESGLRRSKPLSSFIFSCSDNLFERDCGIVTRKAGETISAQILVRKANRTMHLMFRRIKIPADCFRGVIFFEVLLQDHASFASRPCAFTLSGVSCRIGQGAVRSVSRKATSCSPPPTFSSLSRAATRAWNVLRRPPALQSPPCRRRGA